MHALVATYPQSEGPERAGALAGEKAARRPPAAASPFFAQFDTDGDGLISYEEFLLVMSFLAILPEVRAFRPASDIKELCTFMQTVHANTTSKTDQAYFA